MEILRALWKDDSGAVMSAEAVLLGSVVLTGATVGLSTLNESINQELTDLSRAIRSLDQSFVLPGHENAYGARTAGSQFVDDTAADVAGVQLDSLDLNDEESEPSDERDTQEAAPANETSTDREFSA